MNTKKISAMLIAFVMAGAMLTGCGTSVDHKDYMKDSEVTSTVEDNDKDVEKDSDKKSETADKADKDEKKDSKETSDKADKPADNKVADKKSDKDNGSANAGNSNNSDSASKPSNSGNAGNNGSVSKPSTGSGNSNAGNSGNHNGSVNKPTESSKPNNGGNTNNGNHNGDSSNKPAEKPSKPTPPPHVCSFDTVVSTNSGNCQTASSTVKQCSCGKTTTINDALGSHNMVHHDAQGQEVTDYEVHTFCGGCGADFGSGEAGAQAALEHIAMDFWDNCENYSSKPIAVGSHWNETIPAYDECTICGKR